jgi:hypothetical protein
MKNYKPRNPSDKLFVTVVPGTGGPRYRAIRRESVEHVMLSLIGTWKPIGCSTCYGRSWRLYNRAQCPTCNGKELMIWTAD